MYTLKYVHITLTAIMPGDNPVKKRCSGERKLRSEVGMTAMRQAIKIARQIDEKHSSDSIIETTRFEVLDLYCDGKKVRSIIDLVPRVPSS